METPHITVNLYISISFLPYLWGMETFQPLISTSLISSVLTVPMRNGNDKILRETQVLSNGSYRTYEEWKPLLWLEENQITISSYRTYEEWKPVFRAFVLTCWKRSYRTYEEWKHAESKFWYEHIESSYRTYEEWKQFKCLGRSQHYFWFLPYLWGMETSSRTNGFLKFFGSYRTYEEWKPLRGRYLQRRLMSSYRTYEEWKRSVMPSPVWISLVLTVPMRNGNKELEGLC